MLLTNPTRRPSQIHIQPRGEGAGMPKEDLRIFDRNQPLYPILFPVWPGIYRSNESTRSAVVRLMPGSGRSPTPRSLSFKSNPYGARRYQPLSLPRQGMLFLGYATQLRGATHAARVGICSSANPILYAEARRHQSLENSREGCRRSRVF